MKRGQRAMSWETVLAHIICQEGLPRPVLEFPFSAPLGRRHRFDLAWPDLRIALEIDGGMFVPGGGRHQRSAGFMRDQEKLNIAARLGWLVFRTTPSEIRNGGAMKMLREVLANPPRSAPAEPVKCITNASPANRCSRPK